MPSRGKKEYREENRDIIKQRKSDYHERNKDVIAKKRKIYRQENKEVLSEKQKNYRESNKETIKEKHREYRQNNREVLLKSKKDYYNKNEKAILAKQNVRIHCDICNCEFRKGEKACHKRTIKHKNSLIALQKKYLDIITKSSSIEDFCIKFKNA